MPGRPILRLFLLLFLFTLLIQVEENHGVKTRERKRPDIRNSTTQKEYSKRTQMARAWQQEFDRTRDPNLGRVPRHRILKAYEVAQQKRAIRERARAIPGVHWTERGPTNYAGRSRTVVVDPNDPSHEDGFRSKCIRWFYGRLLISQPSKQNGPL